MASSRGMLCLCSKSVVVGCLHGGGVRRRGSRGGVRVVGVMTSGAGLSGSEGLELACAQGG